MEEDIKIKSITIAIFMGGTEELRTSVWKLPNMRIPYQGYEEFGDGDPCLKHTNKCYVWEMEYHKSWDWIMKVVEKINSTHNRNTENGTIILGRDLAYTIQYLLGGGYGFTDYKRDWLPMTVENLFEMVYLFILWKNKNTDELIG